uniref:Uncharacterized protein n=1 Tax=Rhipicephalus zambeziensis TaxID=60191 RepID=A0A224YAL6_9ACAR
MSKAPTALPHTKHTIRNTKHTSSRTKPAPSVPTPIQVRCSTESVLSRHDRAKTEHDSSSRKRLYCTRCKNNNSEVCDLTPAVRNALHGAFCPVRVDSFPNRTIPDHSFLSSFEIITTSQIRSPRIRLSPKIRSHIETSYKIQLEKAIRGFRSWCSQLRLLRRISLDFTLNFTSKPSHLNSAVSFIVFFFFYALSHAMKTMRGTIDVAHLRCTTSILATGRVRNHIHGWISLVQRERRP